MASEKALLNHHFRLQKFPGKGGWTYAAIPGIAQNPNNPFGWVKVRGFIDNYELKQYKLMPMGEGRLFLPVKAAIRKAIGKQAGDEVKITLYLDKSSYQLPSELAECFQDEPKRVYKIFTSFTEGEQKAYVDWIYAAKTEETKAQRILKMMKRVNLGLRPQDKE